MSMQVAFDLGGGKQGSRGAEDTGIHRKGKRQRGNKGIKRRKKKEKRGKWTSWVSMIFESLVSRGVSSLKGKVILL